MVKANTTALFELELVSGNLVLSVLDGEYLRVYERAYPVAIGRLLTSDGCFTTIRILVMNWS